MSEWQSTLRPSPQYANGCHGCRFVITEYSLAWPPVVWLDMAATKARAVPAAAAFCGSRTSATAAAESITLLPFLAAASPAQHTEHGGLSTPLAAGCMLLRRLPPKECSKLPCPWWATRVSNSVPHPALEQHGTQDLPMS